MSLRKVQFAQGGIYHVYNRGANRTSIFLNDDDYIYVLGAMKRYAQLFQLDVIAYCLMRNHYHWLVRQRGSAPARLLPQRVFNGYTKKFNSRHDHSGTLFEGPFRAVDVHEDAYFRRLCLYIHANPVKHGFTTTPELWSYSNYAEWIGIRNGTLYDAAVLEEHFGAAQQYRERMAAYLRTGDHLRGLEE